MAFRECSLAAGRLETVPTESKMVEDTAIPPRAGDTEKEGPGKEARGWACSVGSWEPSTEF